MSHELPPAVLSYASPSSIDVFPATSRAKAIVVLAGISILGQVGELAAYASQHALLKRAEAGVKPTPSEATFNDVMVAVVAGGSGLVTLATYVVLMCWIYRVYRNMWGMSLHPRFEPGWAVGYWFIPILNIVRTYQELREILLLNGKREGETASIGTALWASWLFGFLIPVVYTLMNVGQSDTIADLIVQTNAALVSAALGILTLALLIAFVRRAQRLQENEIMIRAGQTTPPVAMPPMPPLRG